MKGKNKRSETSYWLDISKSPDTSMYKPMHEAGIKVHVTVTNKGETYRLVYKGRTMYRPNFKGSVINIENKIKEFLVIDIELC